MSQSAKNWTFRPPPLLANGHVQSIVGIHWPTGAPTYQAKQHSVALADGDQVMLHEDVPATPSGEIADNTPIVLLLHGLAGCHLSSYMCRMAHRLTELGYRVFRMDMRGCGAGEGIAKLPTHCGQSDDLASALYYLADIYPDAPVSNVAFSMGGTLTLNMLAEAGEMRVGNLRRSFVICSPIDLAHVERHFHTFLGRRYDTFFVRLIWGQILRRWEKFPELAPTEIPQRPKKLREIDERVIAPSGGFTSADDYYEQASPGPKLASIRQEVTIVFSEDDPVVPIQPLLDAKLSSSIEVITTRHGGHLGFLSHRSDDPDFRWLDWRIIDWLAEDSANQFPQVTEQKNNLRTDEPSRPAPHTRTAGQRQTTKSSR